MILFIYLLLFVSSSHRLRWSSYYRWIGRGIKRHTPFYSMWHMLPMYPKTEPRIPERFDLKYSLFHPSVSRCLLWLWQGSFIVLNDVLFVLHIKGGAILPLRFEHNFEEKRVWIPSLHFDISMIGNLPFKFYQYKIILHFRQVSARVKPWNFLEFSSPLQRVLVKMSRWYPCIRVFIQFILTWRSFVNLFVYYGKL